MQNWGSFETHTTLGFSNITKAPYERREKTATGILNSKKGKEVGHLTQSLYKSEDVISILLGEKRQEFVREAYTLFEAAWGKNGKVNFPNNTYNDLSEVIQKIIIGMSSFLPEKIVISFTDEPSIFTNSLLGDFSIYLEAFVEGSVFIEFATTIYQKNEPILGYIGSIEECISKIQNILQGKNSGETVISQTANSAKKLQDHPRYSTAS